MSLVFTKTFGNTNFREVEMVSSPDASFVMIGWSFSQTLAEVCLWAFKEASRLHKVMLWNYFWKVMMGDHIENTNLLAEYETVF